jgi:hypothetical protein
MDALFLSMQVKIKGECIVINQCVYPVTAALLPVPCALNSQAACGTPLRVATGGEAVFLDDAGRQGWLALFGQVCQSYNQVCRAYCLMDSPGPPV